MRYHVALSWCAASLAATSVEAIHLVQRDGPPNVVSMPIQRRQIDNVLERERLRRRQTVQATLDNLETLYFANASLGTPAQNVRLHIDTGSSDLWVNVATSAICTSRGNPCAEAGTYNANRSSTYEYVNSIFNITYADGSGGVGDYVKDTFRLGSTTVTGLQFGIGYSSDSYEGIMGIGYLANEVQTAETGQSYPNVPQLLADQKLISTNAYSLWLNDLDASTGSILFGGVDTQKFHGTLSTLPIIKTRGVYAEFIVALTSVGFDGQSSSAISNTPIAVLLDSGSTLMYLPDQIAQAIYRKYNARYDSRQAAAFVDCNLANEDSTVDFTFTSPTIRVPLNELVIRVGTQRGRPVCVLGISPAGDTVAVLGDTFLRSAYVVYDLTRNEISIAQTNFNATGSNVLEISATNGVPQAEGVPNAATPASVGKPGSRIGAPTVTPTNAASSTHISIFMGVLTIGASFLFAA